MWKVNPNKLYYLADTKTNMKSFLRKNIVAVSLCTIHAYS